MKRKHGSEVPEPEDPDAGRVGEEAGADDAAPDPTRRQATAEGDHTDGEWTRLSDEAAKAEALAQQAASLEDRLKRAQAEFLNETRRIRQQAETDRAFAVQRLLVDLLPLADTLHGAASAGEGSAAGALREGLALVTRQFDEVLARHGVERIEADGQPFDPAKHEALMVVDRPDLPPRTVVEVVRPGFTLNGRVVRPAHVTVSGGPVATGS